jgi:hypothetical protein
MNLGIDESFRFRLNPEQILILYGTTLGIYMLIAAGWLTNSISVRNLSMKFNLLHRNFTSLLLTKVLVQIIAFLIIYWTLVKGPTYFGLDIVSLFTLLYFGMFYATFTLISRGWCITKGPKELSHNDRQLTFLMSFGMTITELVSAGYNKFATVMIMTIHTRKERLKNVKGLINFHVLHLY